MKSRYTVLLVLVLTGCQSLVSDDPHSVWFRLPPGTELVLNRELTIPEGYAHVMLQHGTVARAASEYDVACRFEVWDLGPRVIQPDTFRITGYGSHEEWENYPHTKRFWKTYRLRSTQQSGIMPLVCEYYDWPLQGRPVTHAQVEEALGEYFSFRFPE